MEFDQGGNLTIKYRLSGREAPRGGSGVGGEREGGQTLEGKASVWEMWQK